MVTKIKTCLFWRQILSEKCKIFWLNSGVGYVLSIDTNLFGVVDGEKPITVLYLKHRVIMNVIINESCTIICHKVLHFWKELVGTELMQKRFYNIPIIQYNVYERETCKKIGVGVCRFYYTPPLVILVKKYIFDCKQKERAISFESAKHYLKYHCKIQKSVCKSANREWGFLDAWLWILDSVFCEFR